MRYIYLFSGNKAGEATTRAVSHASGSSPTSTTTAARGPKTTTRMAVDEQWLPVRAETTGHDYWKTPVTERFERIGNRSTWTNSAEKEERQLERPAFYLGINAPPQETWLLARGPARRTGRPAPPAAGR